MSATDAKPTQAESSGTLTAEKVRELMEENSRQYPSPTDPYVWLTEYDWQAIAATLGSCNCSNDCANGERMDVPRLPHFWTHDGVLHIEATRMPTRIVVCEGGTCEFVPKRELDASEAENANLRELANYALKHIIEAECEATDRERFRGKPCEDCAEYGSSDCPKCMPRMFDVSGIEVDG